jgi:polyferredoxin
MGIRVAEQPSMQTAGRLTSKPASHMDNLTDEPAGVRSASPPGFAVSEVPLVKRLLRGRWLHWGLTTATLAVFVVVILTGLFGTPAGNRNFGIIYVWLVWWALLKIVLVPFTGRAWCSLCPIPAPGEWLQRRAMIQPRPGGRLYTLGKKWPRILRNIWPQNLGFLALALFSALILTSPFVTGLILLGFILVSFALSLVFERRAFCRYLCPIGGFVGVYGQVAPVAVRIKDPAVCAAHVEKTCYTGSDTGYGCPYFNVPSQLVDNTYCSLCGECLRSCPRDNIAFFIRKPGADLLEARGRRLDEAFNALMMLGAAFVYSVVLIGPYGWLKTTARAAFTPQWFVYAGALLLFNALVIPGLFWLCVRLGQAFGGKSVSGAGARKGSHKGSLFADYATVLVPLGLAIWMAFTLSFTLINLSYAWPALSDPFGWGWNLFGTAGMAWTPYVSGLIPYLQVPLLLAGLVAAIALALRIARRHGQPAWSAVPVSLFCLAAVVGLLTLYLA